MPRQGDIGLNGHALQCRITTEDPEQNFIPDYGRITAYRGATGFGIRLDGGTAYSGAVITPLLRSAAREGHRLGADAGRGHRAHEPGAARVPHPRRGDQPDVPRERHQPPAIPRRQLHHALHRRHAGAVPFGRRRDRATKLLTYIADVTVNGHPEVKGRAKPRTTAREPVPPHFGSALKAPAGTKQLLTELGPKRFAEKPPCSPLPWREPWSRALMTGTKVSAQILKRISPASFSSSITPGRCYLFR